VTDYPPITARGGVVLISGDALALMYRAVLALISAPTRTQRKLLPVALGLAEQGRDSPPGFRPTPGMRSFYAFRLACRTPHVAFPEAPITSRGRG